MDTLQKKEMVFEQHEKSKGKAYLLWLLFGWLRVHRFYAGKTRSGLAQLLLTLSAVGLGITIIWWLIDAFKIPDMINEHNLDTIDMIYGDQGAPHQDAEAQRALPDEAEECVLDDSRRAMLEDLKQTGYRKQRGDAFSRLYR